MTVEGINFLQRWQYFSIRNETSVSFCSALTSCYFILHSLLWQPTFSWPSLLQVCTIHNTIEISFRALPPHRKINKTKNHPTHFALKLLPHCLPQQSWKAQGLPSSLETFSAEGSAERLMACCWTEGRTAPQSRRLQSLI